MSNDREVESVDPTTGCATRNWKYLPPFFVDVLVSIIYLPTLLVLKIKKDNLKLPSQTPAVTSWKKQTHPSASYTGNAIESAFKKVKF